LGLSSFGGFGVQGFGFWGCRVWEFVLIVSGIGICGLSGLGLPSREGPEELSSLEQAVSPAAQQALPALGREWEWEWEERVLLREKTPREKEKEEDKEKEAHSRPSS
jgi:hypothetical protein